MTEFNTSATFAGWDFLERLLAELSWPLPPIGVDPVATWCGDPNDSDGGRERVVVVTLTDTPDQEWGAIGNYSRDEEFRIPIYVETNLAGREWDQVRVRVRELTSTIEAAIRVVNAGRREGEQPVEFEPFPVWAVAVKSVRPQVQPGQEGPVGKAEVLIEFMVRVGTTPVQ